MRTPSSGDGASGDARSAMYVEPRTRAEEDTPYTRYLDNEQQHGAVSGVCWGRSCPPHAFIPNLLTHASSVPMPSAAPPFSRLPCPPQPIAEDSVEAVSSPLQMGPVTAVPSASTQSDSHRHDAHTSSSGVVRLVNSQERPGVVSPWGGLRAGHQLPPGAYKSAVAACGDRSHHHNDNEREIDTAAPLPGSDVPKQRPNTSSAAASSLSTRDHRFDPEVQCNSAESRQSIETMDTRAYDEDVNARAPPGEQLHEANDTASDLGTAPLLDDSSTVVLELPVPPLRPSPHQLRLAGQGSFTTLFIKHIPPTLTTGMHVQPFVPSEGLVRISVKCICGKNAAFAQYATCEAAFNALVWFYQTGFRRVVSAGASAQSTVLPTRGNGLAMNATPAPPVGMVCGHVPPPGGSVMMAQCTYPRRQADGTDDEEEDTRTGSNGLSSTGQLASFPFPTTTGSSSAAASHGGAPLRGAALCEAIARVTSGMAVALRSRYTLPLPYAVAQQLAGSDDVRLACVQGMVPVLIAEWSCGVEAGRAKVWELAEQPQDYGRALSPLCFAATHTPYRSDEHGGIDQGVAARAVFVRARRDYRLFYCDGQGGCRRLAAARGLSAAQPSAAAAASAAATATPAHFDDVPICTCLLHEASVADRCEFIFVARIMRPHFFSTTFRGMHKFRSFLEPPFRGGCFVSFDTMHAARECVEWFWQQPYLVALFDVQIARRDTLQP